MKADQIRIDNVHVINLNIKLNLIDQKQIALVKFKIKAKEASPTEAHACDIHATYGTIVCHLRLLLAAQTRVEGDEFELSRPLPENRMPGEVLVERGDLGQTGQEHQDRARRRVVVVAVGWKNSINRI